MKDVTIKDIAKKAQVSIMTVSRAINGNYPVSAEVRRRIEAAMQELQYRPNMVARNLRRNTTNLIGLVVADISNHFFMEAAKGLEEEIEQDGYNLIIASSNGKIDKEHRLIDSLMAQRIRGLVIASSDHEAEKINACIEMNIPVVLIDRMLDGVDAMQVGWDNFSGAYQLTKVLIEHGHSDIGIVNVSMSHNNGLRRQEGFLKALKDSNIPCNQDYVSPPNFSHAEAYTWASDILSRATRPTALFCANNIMLEGVLSAMGDLNLEIGTDVSLVAFGMIESNQFLKSKITCLYQDSRAMGKEAGKLLRRQLQHGDDFINQTIVMDTELREGGSVREIAG